MSNQLSVVDRRKFRRLEQVVEHGKAVFIEVGNALRAIRDEKLYRETHKTFERYCEDRWKFKRAQAYRLIEAAEVGENLSPVGDKFPNERQARELAKAPAEERDEIWQEVVETHENPTSEDVKAAVNRRKEHVAPPAAKPEPIRVVKGELVDDEGDDAEEEDEHDETEVLSRPTAPAPSAPPRVDKAAERARQMIPDLCRSLTRHLGNLGAQGRFDRYIDEIEEFAR